MVWSLNNDVICHRREFAPLVCMILPACAQREECCVWLQNNLCQHSWYSCVFQREYLNFASWRNNEQIKPPSISDYIGWNVSKGYARALLSQYSSSLWKAVNPGFLYHIALQIDCHLLLYAFMIRWLSTVFLIALGICWTNLSPLPSLSCVFLQ